jgi:para-aminobenzoate synthetase
MKRPRILFIDAYDSFSNNVVSLLTTLLDADVDILPIDSERFVQSSPGFRDELAKELRCYDAVVCGPGPGSPSIDADVGLMRHIWELEDEHLLPVLGICLGFQSLAVSCGASIRKISHGGLHGMIRDIDYITQADGSPQGNIFFGVPNFKATLYHSLSAEIGQRLIHETGWPTLKWESPVHIPDVVPLAWVEESRDGTTDRILMGMKHKRKPFWGLQYHPESICSEETGHKVITNWFKEALQWTQRHGRVTESNPGNLTSGPRKRSLLAQSAAYRSSYMEETGKGDPRSVDDNYILNFGVDARYTSRSVRLPSHVEVPDIIELLQTGRRDHIILDSASAHANRIGLDVRGRDSIVALDVDDSLRFEYHVGDSYVVVRLPSHLASEQCCSRKLYFKPRQTIWHLLAEFMDRRSIDGQNLDSPFLGGFMGYISYELGLECIDVSFSDLRDHQRPDLCFAWITKSIVIDHLERTLRVQYLHPSIAEAGEWAESVTQTLETSVLWTDGLRLEAKKLGVSGDLTPPVTPTGRSNAPTIQVPDANQYEAKVRQCQDFIAAGESYELCLTDQTSITRSGNVLQNMPASAYSNSWAPSSASKSPSSWQLYRSLRSRQPAPFGSYIRLGGATLISSSPERFLEYHADGLCSMRPMKGTVRRSDAVSTLEQAEKILHIPKEEAENLMIVDLVRHDLHSVCGSGNVTVPQLMKVEEYTSVFQMISVVEGRLPAPYAGAEHTRYTGLDVLAASLPPGSMTGAPKKRSCEILQEIEGRRERSLYSGVVGYMDVAGRGDWSVTIRSLFLWDDETTRQEDGTETEVWHIGAGGAVTALSTSQGEREEMFVKLKGPLVVFEG